MRNYPFVEPTFGQRFSQLAICQSLYDANAFDIRTWKEGLKIDSEMLPETAFDFLYLLDTLKVDFCIVGDLAYLAYVQDRNNKNSEQFFTDGQIVEFKNNDRQLAKTAD